MSDFVWTDEMVMEFVLSNLTYDTNTGWKESIELFKSSKQPKPEWEILKMKDCKGFVHHLCTGCFCRPACTIYSVKRLSDGEVFTVGDEVSWHDVGYVFLISSFKVYMHNMYISDQNSIECELKYLIKNKLQTVLLTPSEINKLKNLLK